MEEKEVTALPAAESPDEDEKVMHEMQERLREHKPLHGKSDPLSYWGWVTKEIKESLFHLHQAQKICKSLDLWTLAINKAAQEMELKQEDVRPLREELARLGSKADHETQDWQFIYGTIEKLDRFTRDLMEKAEAERQGNPLLMLPKVQYAGDLDAALSDLQENQRGNGLNDRQEAVYYAAVREAARRRPGMGIYEADRQIVSLLTEKHVLSGQLPGILACSPRLEHLDVAQKLVDSQRFARHELGRGNERQAEETPVR